MQAASWQNGQATARGPQPPMQPFQSPAQPGNFQQQPQAGAWSQPPASAGGPPVNQPRSGYAAGMQPNSMSSAASASAFPGRKRKRRVLPRVLLVLVLLLAILASAWFFVARPYLHNLASDELSQALSDTESQALILQLALPPGRRTIPISESVMNARLSNYDNSQLQGLHATITPSGMSLTFTAYGFPCTITATPIASNGTIQVTNVQVQGVLWLIMTNDELTSTLNSNFQNFTTEMHRSVESVTLYNQEVDVVIN